MDEPIIRRTRRSVLTAGAAAASALALQSIAASVGARAASGDPLILGTDNEAASTTGLIRSSGTGPTLVVTRTDPNLAALVVDGHVYVNNGAVVSYGGTGLGLSGQATSGTGVVASAEPAGVALRVSGRATFSRSGRVTVRAGRRSATVTQIGLQTRSMVFATLQQYRSGVHIAAAVPIPGPPGRIVIYLNRAVSSDTRVAWFVLEDVSGKSPGD